MAETILPFIRGDRIGSETDYRDFLPVNMYVVLRQIFGVDGYLVQNYGITSFGTASGGKCRGAFYNDRLKQQFRVQGNDFIQVDENGVETILGTVTGYNSQLPQNPPVVMDYSFNTQAVLANNRFYLWNGFSFDEVTDPQLGKPIDFCWVDGYYFFTDGEDLYHTLLTDEKSIEPTDSGVAQFTPDAAIGVAKTEDNKVIVFSRYSIEFFFNDGSADFAFARVDSRSMNIGLVATHLKTEVGGTFFIVGGARNEAIGVYAVSIGSKTKISSREVDKILGDYGEDELVDAHMESYTIDGTTFLKIHLPNETLVFNLTIAQTVGADYSWSYFRSGTGGTGIDRATYAIFDNRISKWIVGDLYDGRIGYYDESVATQYDEVSVIEMFSPLTSLEKQSIDQFEIETIAGFTASDDATVFLSMSYDGLTYGNQDTIEYGMQNDHGRRFIARRLGYIRDKFSVRLKGASRSRMAFARGVIQHG
jgi:hypothetical protein